MARDDKIVLACLSGTETAKCIYRMRRTTELRRASPGYDTNTVTDKDEREIIGVLYQRPGDR